MDMNASDSKLPAPNATFRTSDKTDEFTPSEIRGMVSNPIYAGFGPFPALVSDEQWIAAAAMAIENEGVEQFFVNMLHVLRQTFAEEDL